MDSGGSSTNTTMTYSPEEAARRTQVMDEATRIYNNNAESMSNSPYPGTQPVPFSPDTVNAQNYARNYATGPAIQQASNMNNAVQFGLWDVLFPQSNPALQSSINAAIRPITESYTDTGGVMSQIRDNAIGAGQFGSSRQGVAEGIAAGRYADAIGDTSSRMANENYQKGLDTFSRTLAFAPQALQAGLMPSNILSGIGVQNEQQAQQIQDYLANARMWNYNAPWTPLQNYANIVFGGANPTSSSEVSNEMGPLQAIGTLGSIAMMPLAFGAMSDRRLKEKIVPVSRDMRTGLTIYNFSYLGNSSRYRGVMADEVLRVMPEAVHEDEDGFLSVNYQKLGIPFIQLN